VYYVKKFSVDGIEDLLRVLTEQPLDEEPQLGDVPRLPSRSAESSGFQILKRSFRASYDRRPQRLTVADIPEFRRRLFLENPGEADAWANAPTVKELREARREILREIRAYK
jgi:hypothetical protein